MVDRAARLVEIQKNYTYFKGVMGDISKRNHGSYALIRHQKIIGFFSSITEAKLSADEHYKDRMYSIQKVEDTPVDLGFYSHVDVKRSA